MRQHHWHALSVVVVDVGTVTDLQLEMHSHDRCFLNVAKLHLHVLIAFGFSSGICENKENVTMCCTSHWATSLLCAFCGCCGCCK